MALASLFILAFVIFIAYKSDVNTGLLGLVAAFIFGFFLTTQTSGGNWVPVSSAAGKASMLIGGWSSGMFLTLFGVTFLFGIAKANNTLFILTRRLVLAIGGHNWLLPIAIFIVAAIIAVIGPGPVNSMAIIAPMAGQIAFNERIHPLLMMLSAYMGSMTGGLAPMTPSGYIAVSYSMRGGVNIGYDLLFNMAIAFTLLFIICYIYFRGWKNRGNDMGEQAFDKSLILKKENYITMGVIVVVILCIIIWHLNVGLTALSGAVVLLLARVVTQKEAINNVPWSTILMVCGMGVLVTVVDNAGGITYLTNKLTPFINQNTATPIMIASGALMSAVASASGVVMPTLIPVAIGIGNNLNLDASALIYGVVFGSHLSAISPFSTMGALSLSSAHESVDKGNFFVKLIICAVCFTIIGMILSYFGLLLHY